jgi:hypothetical protein
MGFLGRTLTPGAHIRAETFAGIGVRPYLSVWGDFARSKDAEEMPSASPDFRSPSGVFLTVGTRRLKHGALSYRRFATLRDAIQFVVEEAPACARVYIEVDDRNIEKSEIWQLYESDGYRTGRRGRAFRHA